MLIYFFRSVAQGLRGPGHMFEKGDDELTKQKIRNTNNNCPLIKNQNSTI